MTQGKFAVGFMYFVLASAAAVSYFEYNDPAASLAAFGWIAALTIGVMVYRKLDRRYSSPAAVGSRPQANRWMVVLMLGVVVSRVINRRGSK